VRGGRREQRIGGWAAVIDPWGVEQYRPTMRVDLDVSARRGDVRHART